MDAAERTLLETTVSDAIAGAGASAIDGVLADLGWGEMLESEPIPGTERRLYRMESRRER